MPRTTVYIRNEDWEKWKLVENKSELISEAINRSVITAVERRGETKTIQHIPKIVHKDNEDMVKTCKTHGLPVVSGNKCLQKGCKG